MKRYLLAILASGAWINLSEFLRNELLFKQDWINKYEAMGLSFPSAPINGALWAVWGFLLSICIVAMCRQLSFILVFITTWIMAFLLMWIVCWNLGVLPLGLLPVAIPWSMAEVALAVLIARKIRC